MIKYFTPSGFGVGECIPTDRWKLVKGVLLFLSSVVLLQDDGMCSASCLSLAEVCEGNSLACHLLGGEFLEEQVGACRCISVCHSET